MEYELVELLKAVQAEGNVILDFTPNDERKLAEEIKEEVKNLAASYLEMRNSILERDSNIRDSNIEELKKKIEESRDPLEFREINVSLIRASKQEIIQNALKIVCDRLNAQTAAIFLISKDGILERVGIYGLDESGNNLDNNWFSEESYEVGKSFTGKAAQPQGNSRYGEIQFTHNLTSEQLNSSSLTKYLEKLGNLRCAIAIPLNGRNKTYGVIRVINKIDKATSTNKIILSKAPFYTDDVRLMLFLTAYIANALSNFRRDVQVQIFKYLSRLLIQPVDHQGNSLKNTYQQVVDLLVQNPETAFKAGILRVLNDTTKTLDVQAVSLAPGVTDNRDNSSRKASDDGFFWWIAENRKRLILQKIQEDRITQFKNRDWIEANNFQSLGCFPLIAKDEIVGTLSLYTGYNYEFYPDSVDFLQGAADLIASFVLNVKLEEQKRTLQDTLKPPYIELEIESKFNILAQKWKQDTKAISSIAQMSMHPNYQMIIGLGSKVVPLLLRELAQHPNNPDHWFWALRAITGEDPAEPEQRGRIAEMRTAWLKWGERQGYVY